MHFRKNLLPREDHPLENECRSSSGNMHCFKGGDSRANEQPGASNFLPWHRTCSSRSSSKKFSTFSTQIFKEKSKISLLNFRSGLASMHTAWLREHNRIVTRLKALNVHWNDERLFHEARKIVGAQMQHITYNEWLPLILGERVMEVFDLRLFRRGFYYGYNDSVNPMAANAFSSAAFRFGHSLIPKKLNRCNRQHELLPFRESRLWAFSQKRLLNTLIDVFQTRRWGKNWWILLRSTTSERWIASCWACAHSRPCGGTSTWWRKWPTICLRHPAARSEWTWWPSTSSAEGITAFRATWPGAKRADWLRSATGANCCPSWTMIRSVSHSLRKIYSNLSE